MGTINWVNVEISLARNGLVKAALKLEKAIDELPPFSEQARQLNSIKSDTCDLVAKLDRMVN